MLGWIIVVVVLAVAVAAAVVWALRLRTERDALLAERDGLRAQIGRLESRPAANRRRSRAVRGVVETAVESANRFREGGVIGLVASSIDDLARWAAEDRTEIDRFTSADGTVTVLFSDIEDSTALNEQLGDDAWVKVLGTHDRLVRERVRRHDGHIVKSQGDGFMIVFRTPADAVRAGIDIQDAFTAAERRGLRRTPVRVRVGIHVGQVVERDGDYFGTNVATAARVAGQARGGEILVSDEVRQTLRDVEDIVLVDFRETELKGLPGRHRLWQVAVV